MQFVIFHGSFADVTTDWFPEFSSELKRQGHEVLLPQFPVNSFDELQPRSTSFTPKQSLKSWMTVFEEEVQPKLSAQTIWVGHSLGNVFMLHLLEKYTDIKLAGAIFVVPFYHEVNKGSPHPWQFDVVNQTFYRESFDFKQLKTRMGFTYALYSKDDPYVPNKDSLEFAFQLDCTVIPVVDGKHLGSHLKKFPLAEGLAKSMVGYQII